MLEGRPPTWGMEAASPYPSPPSLSSPFPNFLICSLPFLLLPSSPFVLPTPSPVILLFKGVGPFSRVEFPALLVLPWSFWKPLSLVFGIPRFTVGPTWLGVG